MINSKKKGFTIVELVIVIAVVAILAAVLIPTFSNLVRKANVSSDTALVKNLNTALAVDTNEHNTMGDALAAAKEFGYDITKINAKANGNEILWDSKNDCFVYLDRENSEGLIYVPDTKVEEPEDYELWVIYDDAHPTYSTYLYNCTKTSIETSQGIDTGEYNIDVVYKNDSQEAKNITIKTNGGNLKINAPLDTVKHYGQSTTVEIEAVANASYHEFGIVGSALVKSGRFVAENSSKINQVILKDNAKLDVQGEGSISQVNAPSNNNITGVDAEKIINPVAYGADGSYETNKKALLINSKEDLINALDGTTSLEGYNRIVLNKDLEWNYAETGFQTTIVAETTFDLNGHKITITATTYGTSSHGPFCVTSKEFIILDSQGGGYIKGIANTDYNFDLFHVGNNNGGKLVLESGSLLLEANGGSGNCAFSGVIDVVNNNNKQGESTFVMKGGTISADENQESIRLWNNGGNTANVTIDNGYICGTIYMHCGSNGKGEKLTINDGVLVANKPIRSSYATFKKDKWGDACVITLNGGEIIAKEGAFNGNSVSYKGIIGTSYNYETASEIVNWTAEKLFNIKDNR